MDGATGTSATGTSATGTGATTLVGRSPAESRSVGAVSVGAARVGAARVGAVSAVLHAAQWGALRAWVDAVPPRVLARRSNLDGWSIDELLSHLATSVDAIGSLRPADGARDGTAQPLSVLAYLNGYRQRAAFIRQRSNGTAAARRDRAGELDDAWAAAGPALRALGPHDLPVDAPGGVIRLSDFLLTRLIELVVHGLDLRLSVRALENAGPVIEPLVLPRALAQVAAALRALCVQKIAEQGDGADGATHDREFANVFPDELGDVQLVLIATGRDIDHADLSDTLRAVLPLF